MVLPEQMATISFFKIVVLNIIPTIGLKACTSYIYHG